MSRMNFNWSAVGHSAPNLVHFRIGHSDATISPVSQPVESADPSQAVLKPMNHNIAPGGEAMLACPLNVRRIRVRNMQRKMEAASWVAPVNHVIALGCLMVTGAHLLALASATERHTIAADDCTTAQEHHLVLALDHNNFIRCPCQRPNRKERIQGPKEQAKHREAKHPKPFSLNSQIHRVSLHESLHARNRRTDSERWT